MSDELRIVVGVSIQDDPADVDAAYGDGTFSRLFPRCEECSERYPAKELIDEICTTCREALK